MKWPTNQEPSQFREDLLMCPVLMTHQSKWPRLAPALTAYLSLAGLYLRPVRPADMEMIRRAVRSIFPNVRQLSTRELAEWLADSDRPKPMLADARPEAEYAVSHLQHAQPLNTISKVKAATNSDHTPIIVYCSIGYRSSALAGKLQKAGLANVWNLEGSIFAWANEGRPIFRAEQQVFEVHPYSAKWGNLLEARFDSKRNAA